MIALTPLISQLATQVVGLFQNKSDNELKSEEIKNKLAELLTSYSIEYEKLMSENANKQVDLNSILAQQGKMGWRSWLPAGLSVIFLTGLSLYFLTLILGWGLALFGFDPVHLKTAASLFPRDDIYELWPMLAALGGIYWARGNEKNKVISTLTGNGFNVDKFYEALRRELGGLTQAQVDAINRAIKKATL